MEDLREEESSEDEIKPVVRRNKTANAKFCVALESSSESESEDERESDSQNSKGTTLLIFI
jgi:hypothetical protein